MTTGKIIALTRWIFVGSVGFLLDLCWIFPLWLNLNQCRVFHQFLGEPANLAQSDPCHQHQTGFILCYPRDLCQLETVLHAKGAATGSHTSSRMEMFVSLAPL